MQDSGNKKTEASGRFAVKTAEVLKAEIEAAFGFMPAFFEPAFEHPAVLQSLWEHTRLSYLGNPLPSLFKEKAATLLSRFCSVSYCLVCHSSWLRQLGMKSIDILSLLEQEILNFDEIDENIKWIDKKTVDAWPEPDSLLEKCIFSCCVSIFIEYESARAYAKLRTLLGDFWFNHVVELISWKRTTLNWIESHPELSYESDERVKRHLAKILEEEPRLRSYFQHYREFVGAEVDRLKLPPLRETQKIIARERGATERLQRALERADHIASGLNLGCLTCDLLTLDLKVDSAFREHFRLRSEQVIDVKNIAEIVEPSLRETAVKQCQHAIASGEIMRLKVGHIYLIGWATYDGAKQPLRFEVISFDSTRLPDHKFGSAISI